MTNRNDMSRVIKIKIWDKFTKTMSVPFELSELIFSWDVIWMDRFNGQMEISGCDMIYLQFTGLHDGTTWADLSEAERERWTIDGNMPSEWDGKKIYNGDVFQYTAHDGYMLESFTAEVRWIESYACFGYCKIGLTKECWEQPLVHPFSEHDEFCIDVLPYIKVIGNIYQNPELLNSK